MSEMNAAQHAAESERLLKKSRVYRITANNPDSGGPILREGWRRQADQFLAEAQVHATLAAAKREDEA